VKEVTRLKKELSQCQNTERKIKEGTLKLNPDLKRYLHKRIIQLKTILKEDYGEKV
jgi:ribosomal protein L29